MEACKDLYPFPGRHVYDGVVLSAGFPKESMDKLKDFQIFPEDVILVTYPKSGTAWLSEIAWLILNNADTDKANSIDHWVRIPIIESHFPREEAKIDTLNKLPPGRLFSTHLHSKFFQPQIEITKPKVIHMSRNPKDLLVSFYHFYKSNPNVGSFKGSWDEFFELFKAKQLHSGDVFENILSWWKIKDAPNTLFINYEGMRQKPKQHIQKIASFLGVDLKPEQLEVIAEHTSFEYMKKNPVIKLPPEHMQLEQDSYLRKGAVGDWSTLFTPEQSQLVDKLCQENLAGTGFEFKFK